MPDIEGIVGLSRASQSGVGSGSGPNQRRAGDWNRANGFSDNRGGKYNNRAPNLRSPRRGGGRGRGARAYDEPLDAGEVVPLAMSEDRYQVKRDVAGDEKIMRQFLRYAVH